MHIDIDLDEFRVPIGKAADRLSLTKYPTRIDPLYQTKADYRALLDEYREELLELQGLLYAHHRYAVLAVFQGVDASGKDGAIKHVMSGVNPLGCRATNFKKPTEEELDHDYMWRTSKRLPERGHIGIFNRSYYEEVLVVRVHPEILQNQRLPDECRERPHFWEERYRDIVQFEDYLDRNGTRIIKVFLHLSKEEQRQRLLSRIDDPEKNWKLSPTDLDPQQHWDAYQHAYEQCLRQTSHKASRWYAVPADDKYNARLIISQIILQHMRKLPVSYPEATEQHRREIVEIRRLLQSGL